MMKGRRRWLWAGVALIFLVLAIVLGGRFLRQRAQEVTAQAQTGETVTIARGDLSASATASGRVEAQRVATLALATSGRVETVYVQEGDRVEANEPLVQLEAGALQRAVASAEQSVAIQEANLEQLQEGATAAELAAAEAAVTSAQTQLDDLQDGPSEEEIAVAEANLRAAQASVARASRQLGETQTPADEGDILQAQNALEDAEEAVLEAERNHQRFLDCEQLENGEWSCEPRDLPFVSEEDEAALIEQAAFQVVQARENRNAAQADLDRLQQGADENVVGASQASVSQAAAQRDASQANLDLLLAGASEAELAAARSSLADAEANLAQLQEGPGTVELARAETQLAQAQISLERAQKNLERATLRAPFAGVVTAVYVSEGELASGVAVDLLDPASMEVVLDVDEIDVGDLAVGQPAQVTFQPWPDEIFDTGVASIAPAANSLALDSAIASFGVRLALPETDLPIREGMTADASLQTASREDVLLAPNRAIIVDRETGRYFVNLVETDAEGNETTRRVEVTVGLRDNRYTEITSGLAEGDRVRVGPVVQPVDLFQPGGGPPTGGPPEGGGPFGGGS